jgi:hypothetical protein
VVEAADGEAAVVRPDVEGCGVVPVPGLLRRPVGQPRDRGVPVERDLVDRIGPDVVDAAALLGAAGELRRGGGDLQVLVGDAGDVLWESMSLLGT